MSLQNDENFLILDCGLCYAQLLSHVRLFAAQQTVACQVLLCMGYSRQEYWSGVPLPTPEDLPHPGIEPTSFVSPALAGRFFFLPLLPPRKPLDCGDGANSLKTLKGHSCVLFK